MAWNNANQNGRFGPFSGGSSPLQTGLNNSSTSTQTDPGAGSLDNSGVLPTGPSMMVSDNPTGGGGGGSLASMPSAGGATETGNGSALAMADGGILPEVQGGTVPDMSSALAVVQQALQTGRKKFGLPAQLIGGNKPSSADFSPQPSGAERSETHTQGSDTEPYIPGYGNEEASSYEDGGQVIPGAANPDEGLLIASQAQREAMQKAALRAKEGQGSDVLYPGANSYADGGAVEGDMDNPSNQGMPQQPMDNSPVPQQGQTQPANSPNSPLAMYAMGAGAIPPEVASALEARVDPQGAMDPSQRKLLAIASAPPEAQFGLMQHYRQRFQALNAFARAAGEGTQARPANIAASTEAATRAFHNVPNGHSVSFAPAGPDHVAVTVANYAGGKKQRGYAAGGAVPDDVPLPADRPDSAPQLPNDPEGMGDENESGAQGVLPDADEAAKGAQDVEANADETMTQPDSHIKQFVMSVPQYLSAIKNSLFDKLMDTPSDNWWDVPTGDQQQPQGKSAPAPAAKPGDNGVEAPIGAMEDVYGGAPASQMMNSANPMVGSDQQPNAGWEASVAAPAAARAAAPVGNFQATGPFTPAGYRSSFPGQPGYNEQADRLNSELAKQGQAGEEPSRADLMQLNAGRRTSVQAPVQQPAGRGKPTVTAPVTPEAQTAARQKQVISVALALVKSSGGTLSFQDALKQANQGIPPVNAPAAAPSANPTPADISYLRAHPEVAAKFDQRFGQNLSRTYLGAQ